MNHQIIKREVAHAQGLKRFYTGRPCKFGHDSQRFVSTGNCIECAQKRVAKFARQQNAEGGKFIYPLKDPADFAAAWAFCQALDMARGHAPTLQVVDSRESPTPEQIESIRREVFKFEDIPRAGGELDPSIAAQLRAAGML